MEVRSLRIPAAAAALAIVAAIVFTTLHFGPVDAATKPPAPEDGALAKLGLATVGVAILGGLALYAIRKAGRATMRRRNRDKTIEVVDLLPLGGKRSIAVARVYDRVLVLGLGEGPVTLLTELREEEAGLGEEREKEKKPSGSEAFRGLLSKMAEIRPAPRRRAPSLAGVGEEIL